MIIYVDVLVALNFIMDFLLLSLSSVVARVEIRAIRQILASLFGGLISLYIFFDSNSFLIDITFRFITSIILVFLSIGMKYKNGFIKFYFSYVISTFFIGGIMQFFSESLKLSFIAVNNTIVYLNISPLLLIFITFLIYIAVKIFFKFRKKLQIEDKCKARLFLGEKEMVFNGLIDTGNKVKDILGNGEIIFISPLGFIKFIGDSPENAAKKFKNRFRAVPISTINGSNIKKGIRIDKAEIICGKNLFEIKNPILLASDDKLDNDFDIIISSDVILRTPVRTFKEEACFEN